MGKLITLLVLAGLGFGIYWKVFHKSPAYLAYLKWEAATKEGNCAALNEISMGKAKEWVAEFCAEGSGMTVFGMTIKSKSPAQLVSEMGSSPGPRFRRMVESETEAEDGTVSLVVYLIFPGNPGGAFKPPDPRKQMIKALPAEDGSWKITEFAESEAPELAK